MENFSAGQVIKRGVSTVEILLISLCQVLYYNSLGSRIRLSRYICTNHVVTGYMIHTWFLLKFHASDLKSSRQSQLIRPAMARVDH